MTLIIRYYYLILVLFCLVACEKAEPSVRAKASVTQIRPKRIISLAPSLTEELFLLKSGHLLLADTAYCNRPPAAKKKPKIGTLLDFSLEQIVALNPDLLLCTSLANRQKLKKIRKLGIRIIELAPPRSFEQISATVLELGKVLYREELANRLVAQARAEVDYFSDLTARLPKKRVFMQIGAHPLATVPRDYFINDYIRYAGGVSITGQTSSHLYSRESVLTADPEVILIADMGVISAEEKRNWENYPTISAVQTRSIHVVNSEIFCQPTLTAFIESLRLTIQILYPELKTVLAK
jgi:iron complex transport system substrate-binding protein